MAAGKKGKSTNRGGGTKAVQSPPRVQSPPSVPVSPPPPTPTQTQTSAAKKKNKKKKGKGKAVDLNPNPDQPLEGEEDEGGDYDRDEGITSPPPTLSTRQPPGLDSELTLPPLHSPHSFPPGHTGLSPTLESVHFSTTASLNASATTNPVAQNELLATANDLYRNMGMMHGPAGEAGVGIGVGATGGGGVGPDDEEYWAAYPAHIKQFVRSVWQKPSSITRTSGDLKLPNSSITKAQAMYTIAQQMVQSHSTNTTTGTTTEKGGGRAMPTLPFDPSMFSDPAFGMSMQQAAAAYRDLNGHGAPLPGQQPGSGPSMGSFYISEDEEEEVEEEEEEEEGDEELIEQAEDLLKNEPARAVELILSYQEALHHQQQQRANTNNSNSGNPRQQQKMGVKSNINLLPNLVKNPTPSSPAPVAAIRKPSQTVPPSDRPTSDIQKQMPTAANQRPTHPQQSPHPHPPPPPSSRAAGKQPMSYAPPSTGTGTGAGNGANANNGQGRTSARAASKAPLPPHAYPHNHSHHHPSPPSSNASAPHKPRPPASNNPNPPAAGAHHTPPTKPNKIWSTSSTEERERIKEFWLGLGEEERRNLVKIEKDTVLRKMKEQQKHSCSCAVCGRKRYVSFLLVDRICLLTFSF